MEKNSFKAWDKELKIMVFANENDSADYWDGVVSSDVEVLNNILNNNYYEWLQCTGLIDVKGNKIFDRDLIKDDENFIWEVFYKQGAFYAKCDDLMAEQLLSSVNLYGVVIGNVFEKEDGHEGK